VEVKKKKTRENQFLFLYGFFLIIIILFSFGFFKLNIPTIKNNVTNYINSFDCDNSSYDLFSAVNCLNQKVSENYNYNDSEANNDVTINDTYLYLRGGDCKDYTDYYERHLNALGYFNTSRIIYDVNDSASHVYLIVYDNHYHCTIDETEYKCFTRGN
jgi:hypothetical protein